MFEFLDPAGRDFLGNTAAKRNYQEQMQSFYDRFSALNDSAFTSIEAFDELAGDQQPSQLSINWIAFPLLATGTNALIDTNRFRFQDEYVEWQAELQGGTGTITFTTELPEYFQAFAFVGTSSLIDAIQDVIPGANPTAEELFGAIGSDPDSVSGRERSALFRRNLVNNPWNNGTKGILCLTQEFNTLNALFNLVGQCGIRQNQGTEEDTCGLVGGACGVGRSSDPQVCKEAQAAVRAGFGITLADPSGIRIVEMRGVWKVNGNVIGDINDSAVNLGIWTVSRNGRRAVLKVEGGLTLGDDPIVTGAQVSLSLVVGANLLAAPESSLPIWARTGNEGMRSN